MKMTRIALSVAALTIALAGCNSSEKTTSASTAETKTVNTKAVNARCPIAGEELGGAPAKTVAYHNQTVGFCCANCANKWAALTDAQKDSKLAAAMK